jgi:hypothetical protein
VLYIILRGHWYDTVLNVFAPTEDRNSGTKDSSYEVFSNEQFGKTVYLKSLMIMWLE